MSELPLLIVAAVLLVGLLWFEGSKRVWHALVAKTGVSILFVVTALLQPWGLAVYSAMVVAGVLLSLVGDVLLAIPGRATFIAGLGSFLLGHVCYLVAFATIGAFGLPALGALAVLVVVAILVFRWLAPHLGKMRVPVIAYMAVISVMVFTAVGVAAQQALPFVGRVLVLVGAVAFYVSDVLVARHRFVDDAFVNRLVGLPLYYSAQFIFAFSLTLLA